MILHEKLEMKMECNQDFKLLDLGKVEPMNCIQEVLLDDGARK